jgi:RimJ/RimL family protein N-acetyltransferase
MMTNELDIQHAERLNEARLEILRYWAEDMPLEFLDQLIAKSREAHVLKFEGHEDAAGRFKDRQAFIDWRTGKKRLFYLLVENSNLAGVIWFGEKHNPHIDANYSMTFGIRLYEGYVGRGLSKEFMKLTHDDMKHYFGTAKIWLDFAEENIAAEKAYQSFGYKTLRRIDGRVIMGL